MDYFLNNNLKVIFPTLHRLYSLEFRSGLYRCRPVYIYDENLTIQMHKPNNRKMEWLSLWNHATDWEQIHDMSLDCLLHRLR